MSADPQLLQARLAHLSAIQTIIARMAGYSAAVKNFAVTVTAGMIGIAWGKTGTAPLFLAGFCFALIFMCLDGYYLALERAFRGFHTAVCTRPLDEALDQTIAPGGVRISDLLRACGSFSVWVFYSPLFAVLGLLTLHVSHG